MIDITIEQFNLYMFNAGLLGCFVGVLLLAGLAVIIQIMRKQYVKRYIQEQPEEKREKITNEIRNLEISLKKLAEETNTTFFKSVYNEIQNLKAFLKQKFI